jgi:hypothetical protein
MIGHDHAHPLARRHEGADRLFGGLPAEAVLRYRRPVDAGLVRRVVR